MPTEPNDSIYQILGNVEKEIRKSYSGGAVDVYLPSNKITYNYSINKFKKLFYYDVNSLYPTVMANNPMPVGKPVYFEGDILKLNPEAFGFFYCKITSPQYLEHPILQRRIKTSSGIRTIAGLGNWEGYIFSEEMNNAIKYGYKFKVISGYEFKQGNLFSEYVNKMYNLRIQYDKSHPMNYIAKLLLNSLYGKFGMNTSRTVVEIHDCSSEESKMDFLKLLDIFGESISDYIQIGDKFIIIRDSLSHINYDEEGDLYHGLNVNIAIASAVTSYARVYMSSFKNNPNFNLYYSDTDSIVIDQELPNTLIGNELGQLKLEHIIERGVFLAPKVYGLINDKGESIIKVKGLKEKQISELTLDDLESLLIKNSNREFTQEKWNKHLFEGQITTNDVIYTLKVNSNKRVSVYDVDNRLMKTEPYYYFGDSLSQYPLHKLNSISLLLP
jgi:hypothetical protein